MTRGRAAPSAHRDPVPGPVAVLLRDRERLLALAERTTRCGVPSDVAFDRALHVVLGGRPGHRGVVRFLAGDDPDHPHHDGRVLRADLIAEVERRARRSPGGIRDHARTSASAAR